MNQKIIYLDNSATTPLCEEAKKTIIDTMDHYGNPSSVHQIGLEAHTVLERARTQVAKALGLRDVKPGQLIFTGSGTEATNTALVGVCHAKSRVTARRIITTDSEHPSVERTLEQLEKEGFEIVKIPTKGGALDFAVLETAIEQPVMMASMMLVNNETGAFYDVAGAFARIKARWPEAVLHCDAVQGFLKVPMTPRQIGCDLMTVSGHKIGGPKGVGALFIKGEMLTGKKIVPYIRGGGQETGMRSGTENILGIAGFGTAAEQGMNDFSHNLSHMKMLSSCLTDKLQAICPDVSLNLPLVKAPHIINVTTRVIKSETMLHYLSSRGICVSAGSACSAHAKNPSSALLAYGLTPKEADTSLRISLGVQNTMEDIDTFVIALREGLDRLVHIR